MPGIPFSYVEKDLYLYFSSDSIYSLLSNGEVFERKKIAKTWDGNLYWDCKIVIEKLTR